MTIFERIIAREIPAQIIHEDDLCIAIHDINPQAPTHLLIIPKKPVIRVSLSNAEERELLGHLLWTGGEIAKKLGVDQTGFRLVINNGPDAGETVPHLHVHLLAGRSLHWPPG